MTNNAKLWFEYPAENWDSQALHLGNGYMGASFYGGVKEERFDLAEKTFWTGGPGENPAYSYGNRTGGKDRVKEIRAAVVSGRTSLADSLVAQHFFGDNNGFGSFSMIGNLFVTFANHDEKPQEYKRELDLAQSVARVSYKMDGVSYAREYFCSFPDRILAMRFKADTDGKIGFSVRLSIVQKDYTVSIHGGRMDAAGKIDGNNRAFRVKLKLLNSGGTFDCAGDTFRLTGATSAVMLLTAATEYKPEPPLYKGNDPEAITNKIMAKAAGRTYAQLKATHVADYRNLYDRVKLRIAGNPEAEKLPTNLRWEGCKKGQPDAGLKKLAFNLGRYLIISASRPGALPSTLQGVWNTFSRAPWNGNYQSNINLQLMYMPCGPVNLPECQQAYTDYIERLVIPGRETAAKYYGTRGWVSHATGNIWGYTAPGIDLLWGIYPAGAAWHCRHLWEQYAFTCDIEYLKHKAYPVMKEAAQFWLENLVPFNGHLIAAPAVSAEHGGEFRDGRYVEPTINCEAVDRRYYRFNIAGTYQDVEMVWDLLTNVMEAADLLGVDKDFHNAVQKTRDSLLPLRIGKHGQLQEWYDDIDSPEDHHRHIAHLYAVHPGRQISPLATPLLADAAKTSLNLRGDGFFAKFPYSGGNWARAWRVWCWARLLDGERANKIFTELLAEQSFENLMTFQHLPGARHMQVDASMSTPGFMAEMLMQSHFGEIHLLPALPAEWKNGSVEGLIARGGCTVDIKWQDGKLVRARIAAQMRDIPAVRVQGAIVNPETDGRIEIKNKAVTFRRCKIKS